MPLEPEAIKLQSLGKMGPAFKKRDFRGQVKRNYHSIFASRIAAAPFDRRYSGKPGPKRGCHK